MKSFLLALIIIFSVKTAYASEVIRLCPEGIVQNSELIVLGTVKKVKTEDHFVRVTGNKTMEEVKCSTSTYIELQPLKILKASEPLRSGPLTIWTTRFFDDRKCPRLYYSAPRIDVPLDEGTQIIAAASHSAKEEWAILGAFDPSRLGIIKAYIEAPRQSSAK